MINKKAFYIDEWLKQKNNRSRKDSSNEKTSIIKLSRFQKICRDIKYFFEKEWEKEQGKNKSSDKLLYTQKRAIIGYRKEVSFFKDKIKDYISDYSLEEEWFPHWYKDLIDGVFHENWGLAGIAKWNDIKESTSAKIIGSRIYFMVGGKLQLQIQNISKERVERLIKSLLLRTPDKRFNEEYFEVYMLNGTRITIYGDTFAKETVIVFRKYIIKNLTFEKQAQLNTIPECIIPMLKSMVKIGYNVNFVGAVRTGKTTFLETWQSYEDPMLEGIQIETDPEIPLHKIMPRAPIIQLVADGDKLKKIMKNILRSDADYIIMAEARDAIALNIAVKAANKGTKRVKSTFHTTDVEDFCYDVACEIISEFGGEINSTMIKVAKSFNYLFEFVQLKDRSQKRLKGIYEITYNSKDRHIQIIPICKYNFVTDSWGFNYYIGEDKEEIALENDLEAFIEFKNVLKYLAEKYPIQINQGDLKCL